MKNRLIHIFAGAAFAALLAATAARAQVPSAEAQSPLAPQGPSGQQNPPASQVQRLEQMLAPIALYPDELLGDILMAATYPLDVVKAARWLLDPHNASLKGDELFAALKDQDWDPSVKSLAPFPRILRMMDANLEWTESLGEAFLADPGAVMDAVQRLRRRAQSAGRLYSTPEEIVRPTEEAITIEAPGPGIVYVPVYDSSTAYGPWPYAAYPPYAFPGFFCAGACGWLSAPIVAPLIGLHRLNFLKHRIEIDRDRFAKLNRDHAPIGGEEWRHDPSHRGNVPYRDAAVAARFGAALRSPEFRPAIAAQSQPAPTFAPSGGGDRIVTVNGQSFSVPHYQGDGVILRGDAPSPPPRVAATLMPGIAPAFGFSPGPRPRIDRPFPATWPQKDLIPPTDRPAPFVRPPASQLPQMRRSFSVTWPESALVPRTAVAEPFVRPQAPPVYGPGVAAPSVRGFSPISAPPLARSGGGHYFSAPVGARAQMPPAVVVLPFLGGVRGR